MKWYLDPYLKLYLPLWKLDGTSLRSEDAHGHLATVIGATWGLQGRTFDGLDDVITIPSPAALNFGTGAFTLEVWAKLAVVANDYRNIIRKGGAEGFIIRVTGQPADTLQAFVAGVALTAAAPDLNWHLYHLVRDASGAVGLYQDLVLLDSDSAPLTVDTAADFTLGNNVAHTEGWKGIIGEARCYNRDLSLGERLHNYQATKWRYK